SQTRKLKRSRLWRAKSSVAGSCTRPRATSTIRSSSGSSASPLPGPARGPRMLRAQWRQSRMIARFRPAGTDRPASAALPGRLWRGRAERGGEIDEPQELAPVAEGVRAAGARRELTHRLPVPAPGVPAAAQQLPEAGHRDREAAVVIGRIEAAEVTARHRPRQQRALALAGALVAQPDERELRRRAMRAIGALARRRGAPARGRVPAIAQRLDMARRSRQRQFV